MILYQRILALVAAAAVSFGIVFGVARATAGDSGEETSTAAPRVVPAVTRGEASLGRVSPLPARRAVKRPAAPPPAPVAVAAPKPAAKRAKAQSAPAPRPAAPISQPVTPAPAPRPRPQAPAPRPPSNPGRSFDDSG